MAVVANNHVNQERSTSPKSSLSQELYKQKDDHSNSPLDQGHQNGAPKPQGEKEKMLYSQLDSEVPMNSQMSLPTYASVTEGDPSKDEKGTSNFQLPPPQPPQDNPMPPAYGLIVADDQKKVTEKEKEGADAPLLFSPPGYNDGTNNDQKRVVKQEDNMEGKPKFPPPPYGVAAGGAQFSQPSQLSALEVRNEVPIKFDAPPGYMEGKGEGNREYSAVNPPGVGGSANNISGQQAQLPKDNPDEINFDQVRDIINSVKMYTDKFSSIRSIITIQKSKTSMWDFYSNTVLKHKNEKTKEYIKAEYDKIVNQYISDLEDLEKKIVLDSVFYAQSNFIHEIVMQKMLGIEVPPIMNDSSEYETIRPDELFDKIMAKIDIIPLTSFTQLPQEDYDNFIQEVPQLARDCLIDYYDEVEKDNGGASQIEIKELTKEELKLEEFLSCINNVLLRAKSLKIFYIKKIVIYDGLFSRFFAPSGENPDLNVFETVEKIMDNAFKPREGLEPFYTYFIKENIIRSLNELDKRVPANTIEYNSIKQEFWEVVELIHKRQNARGGFKYFRIVKPKELADVDLQEFTELINKDLEMFLDIKFVHSVIPFECNNEKMMIYATNDRSIYTRVPGFQLVIKDKLCRVEPCESLYLKADKLNFASMMEVMARSNINELNFEYITSSTQNFFLIVFPTRGLANSFYQLKDSFIPQPSAIAPNSEDDEINKFIKNTTEKTTNVRSFYLNSELEKINTVRTVMDLNTCWDAELWKRYYTRFYRDNEEYRRKLRVYAAAYGNIIFEKKYYKMTARNNPSDLSLFSIKLETQTIPLTDILRFVDGYITCEKGEGLTSFEGVKVAEKFSEEMSTLDFMVKSKLTNSKEIAYVILVSGKDSFIGGWDNGKWGGDLSDEVDLLYRTTLQPFITKKIGMDSLFYDPKNTVYFKNVRVYREGIEDGFRLMSEKVNINVVIGLAPEKPEDLMRAWVNALNTAISMGAKNIVVGGRKENAGIVKRILSSK